MIGVKVVRIVVFEKSKGSAVEIDKYLYVRCRSTMSKLLCLSVYLLRDGMITTGMG
jgi:hypothetical protein